MPSSRKRVGSRTGAVRRRSGLSVAPRFLWECLTSPTVCPFPAPATSNGAGGFPALRSPVHFAPSCSLRNPLIVLAHPAGRPGGEGTEGVGEARRERVDEGRLAGHDDPC